MKVINISDEWTPADEEEVKALPINEKWRAPAQSKCQRKRRILQLVLEKRLQDCH